MFKLIIAGSRGFSDYSFLKERLDHLLQNVKDEIEIVSGTAKGADRLGERYAKERGYKISLFPADWEKYELGAGPKRNEEMAKYADACICFWMNKSKGTKNMIDNAKKYKLKLRIYNC